MKKLTIDQLREILVACAGEDEADAFTGDISELDFDALGYDSLALIETAARLKQEHGVVLPEELITEVRTPGELLDLVNDRLSAAA